MKLLCTLGPSTFNQESIKKLTNVGVDLFRINLSHTKVEDLERLILLIRRNSDVPICLDSEGAQIRTGDFKEPTYSVFAGEKIRVPNNYVLGEKNCFNLYPLWVINKLEIGTLISIDFNAVLAIVEKKDAYGVTINVINGGTIGRNKAVTVDQEILLEPLTKKDIEALAVGVSMGIKYVALSFAQSSTDVITIRKKCLEGTRVISKIECLRGLQNLDEIILESDEILIDRGDLSREVPLESVPIWQREITNRARKLGKPVNVATNLLETMVTSPLPTRAEINDVFSTIISGATGLVLAAETAIGKYPVQCAVMIKKIIAMYEMDKENNFDWGGQRQVDFLPSPHGGRLIQNFIKYDDKYSNYQELVLSHEHLMDVEQIAHGTFSPIKGFMGEAELQSVLYDNKLLSGDIWTLPVLLQVNASEARRLKKAENVLIKLNGQPHSLIKINKIYKIELEKYLIPWFGTDNPNHPGVKKVTALGEWLIESEPYLFENTFVNYAETIYSPRKLRSIFQKLGWQNVVGFHTRNIPHSAHEFIQTDALRRAGVDGMLISPVMGSKKSGDFESKIVIETYELLIKNKNRINVKYLLSGFGTYSRFAGPREAVFTALCRKNMGCSHFIVGRDHTGVGEFYKPTASQEIFEIVGALGIEIITYPEIGYNSKKMVYEFKKEGVEYNSISGTDLRNKLTNNDPLPDWYINSELELYLRDQIKSKRGIFIK